MSPYKVIVRESVNEIVFVFSGGVDKHSEEVL